MDIIKMNIWTSGLWPITLFFFFGVAVIMYFVAKAAVKKGTYETKYDKDNRPYQQLNPYDIHPWYEHISGKGAIVMAVLGILSIWVLPYLYEQFG